MGVSRKLKRLLQEIQELEQKDGLETRVESDRLVMLKDGQPYYMIKIGGISLKADL